MALTNTSIHGQGAAAATLVQPGEFPGDEFSNNLFSDLAPLLTLFGEQVTKQFLSMSMGWADNVLLAMGPLGIITVVISAIRVGGVKKLKAIVGRARESKSIAEAELLSSTSADVCELWNGHDIVRTLGKSETIELVLAEDTDGLLQCMRLDTAFQQKYLDCEGYLSQQEISVVANQSPNIALNVQGTMASGMELWFWAALGILLQLTALVVPALTTYYWKWPKSGRSISAYGYPCFLIGTVAVVLGVACCGHVVETSSSETEFIPGEKSDKIKLMFRLQKACTVSEQHFGSYMIFNSPDRQFTIRTSRLNNEDNSIIAAVATLFTVAGFICQFIGLRALHWSATVIQLGVTIIMTAVRAWVRRGMAAEPHCCEIPEGHEFSWLALYADQELQRQKDPDSLVPYCEKPYAFGNCFRENRESDSHCMAPPWELLTGGYHETSYPPTPTMGLPVMGWSSRPIDFASLFIVRIDPVDQDDSLDGLPSSFVQETSLRIRAELNGIVPDSDSEAARLTQQLVHALEVSMDFLTGGNDFDWIERPQHSLSWTIPIVHFCIDDTARKQLPWVPLDLPKLTISISARRHARGKNMITGYKTNSPQSGTFWEVNRHEIYAVLSLWIFSITTRDWSYFRQYAASYQHTGCLRIVGTRTNYSELQALKKTYEDVMEMPIYPCPKPDERACCTTSHTESAIETPRPWPVFGLCLSSFAQRHPSNRQPAPDGQVYEAPPQQEIQKMYGQSHLEWNMPPTELAIHSPNIPLSKQCALDIFVCFLTAVASRLRTIKLVPDDPGPQLPISSNEDTLHRGSNRSKYTDNINELARILKASGLVDNIRDAYAMVLPPFVTQGLFPLPDRHPSVLRTPQPSDPAQHSRPTGGSDTEAGAKDSRSDLGNGNHQPSDGAPSEPEANPPKP